MPYPPVCEGADPRPSQLRRRQDGPAFSRLFSTSPVVLSQRQMSPCFSQPEVLIQRHSSERPWTYEKLDRLQRKIAERVRGGGPGALLLSEVAPVITLGRRTRLEDLLLPPESYARLGIEIQPTDRGGLATYHGPGQWVLFAVDGLERLTGDPRGVRKAVNGLLQTAEEVARRYQAEVRIGEGLETGVWAKKGKVAAVGVHIEQGVLLHGLSLHGFQTPTSFLGLRPCGLEAPVAYLLENEEGFEGLGETLIQAAQKCLWRQSAS